MATKKQPDQGRALPPKPSVRHEHRVYPGRPLAPVDPGERAAFLRAIDLAEHFRSLAWDLAGGVADSEDRAAARLEIEEAAKLLADVREPEHLIQDAIVSAVQRCVALPDPDPFMLFVGKNSPGERWPRPLSVKSSLARLRQEYPVEGARIKDDTFAAAVEARREAVARKRAEYGSNEQDQWRAIVGILEQAMPSFCKTQYPRKPGEDDDDHRTRTAGAVERRNRRARRGK